MSARKPAAICPVRSSVKPAIGVVPGVANERFFCRHFLVRQPAVGVGPINGAASDCAIQTGEWIQRGHGPVRTERDHGTAVNQRAKRIGPFQSVRPDALHRPPTIVDSVIRLHGRNHLLFGKSRNRSGRQVLGVLDAKPSVAWTIFRGDLGEEIQHIVVGLITNSVYCNLQAVFVGARHPGAQILQDC